MRFTIVPKDQINAEHYPTTARRWQSEGGGWWIDMTVMFYGIRCNVGPSAPDGLGGFDVTYCCGQNRLALLLVPAAVMKILEPLDEATATSPHVRDLFPEQQRKPIDLDEACWAELCRRAGVDPIDLSQAAVADPPQLLPFDYAAATTGAEGVPHV
jgi:hypothetical protein